MLARIHAWSLRTVHREACLRSLSLAAPFKMSMPAVSKHLNVLERLDLMDAYLRELQAKEKSRAGRKR